MDLSKLPSNYNNNFLLLVTFTDYYYENLPVIHFSSVNGKITLATECRSALLGSIIAFKCGQEALPQVDIPCITNRQIVAVSHANEYLLTDIADLERYQHTKTVLEAYRKSLIDSVAWLNDVFQKSLRKDLQEAEEVVATLSKELREFRSEYIRRKIGYRIQSSENHVNVINK